jgi:transmembrane sensor
MNPSLSRELIEEQAARWTARLDGGELTTADRLALHAWLDEAPAHRAAFEHYQLICDDTAESLPVLAQVSAVARPDTARVRRAPRWLPAAIGLAAAVALGALWLVPWWRDTGAVSTAAAQRSTLALPDGTRAELNARTALRTDFRSGRRTIRLERGEAFFAVAKDSAHPFLVETPAGAVRVTGTQFNVRLAAGGRPEVTLLEGAVEIENGLARLALAPGQQLSAAGRLVSLTPDEMARALAWREGRIVLNGLTLAEAAARFAEFHGQTVTVAPGLAERELGGSLALDDLQGFFDVLSEGPLGLRVVRRGDNHFTIVPR